MNLLSLDDRKEILDQIRHEDNIARKNLSVYQYDIFKNKLKKHVTNFLKSYISESTISQMAMVHNVGMCERIVKQEASLYENEPSRHFDGVSEDQSAKLKAILQSMKYNEKNKLHNRVFKLQHQAISKIVPKNKRLEKKVLYAHQFDVIMDPEDSEKVFCYVISNFSQPKEPEKQRYVIWSTEYNFTMDGNGLIKTDPKDLDNPIKPLLPFAEASGEKDGSFYIDEEETNVDFTVLLNAALTELFHVMRMQGFGQAVLTGTSKSLPKGHEIQVGINSVMCLISEDGVVNPDFKFVNANPDLAGSIEVISTLLSSFLSSKGIDPKTINIKGDSPKTFSSGWERFLALIDEFRATQDDMEIFKNVEQEEFNIIKAWHNVAIGADLLDKELVSTKIPDSAKMRTAFVKPEMIMSEPEKAKALSDSEDMGYISHLDAIKRLHNVETDKEAQAIYQKIQEDNASYPKTAKTEVIDPADDNQDNQDNQA